MDVRLNNEEFTNCKRSVIIYLVLFPGLLFPKQAFCDSQVIMLCLLWAEPGLTVLTFPQNLFRVFFAGAHLDSCCVRCESTVPLPRGGPGDSPPEQGQDKALCDIPGVCPPPPRASDTFLLPKLPSFRQHAWIKAPDHRNLHFQIKLSLLQKFCSPEAALGDQGRWKIKGFGHWKCRLSLLTFSLRWSNGRNSKPLM